MKVKFKMLVAFLLVIPALVRANYEIYYTNVGGVGRNIRFLENNHNIIYIGQNKGFMLWNLESDDRVSYCIVNDRGTSENRFISLSEDTLLVFDNHYASKVDISEWTSPKVVSTIYYHSGTDTIVHYISSPSGYLFLVVPKGSNIWAELIKIYDTNNMQLVYTYDPEGDRAIVMADIYQDTLLITMETDSLKIFNINYLPDSMPMVSALEYSHGLWGGVVQHDSSRIYATTHWVGELVVIDISNPYIPAVMASNLIYGLHFHDRAIRLASRTDSITYLFIDSYSGNETYIIDVTDFDGPQYVASFNNTWLSDFYAEDDEARVLFLENSNVAPLRVSALIAKILPNPPYLDFQNYRDASGEAEITMMVMCKQPIGSNPQDTVISIVAIDTQHDLLHVYRPYESMPYLLNIQDIILQGYPYALFHDGNYILLIETFAFDSTVLRLFVQDDFGGRLSEVGCVKLGDYTFAISEIAGPDFGVGTAWDSLHRLLFISPYDSLLYMYRVNFHPFEVTLVDSLVSDDQLCDLVVSRYGLFGYDGHSYLATSFGPRRVGYDESGFTSNNCLRLPNEPPLPARYFFMFRYPPPEQQWAAFSPLTNSLPHFSYTRIIRVYDFRDDSVVWDETPIFWEGDLCINYITPLQYMEPWASWIGILQNGDSVAGIFPLVMGEYGWEADTSRKYQHSYLGGGGYILRSAEGVFYIGGRGIVSIIDTSRQSINEGKPNHYDYRHKNALELTVQADMKDGFIRFLYNSHHEGIIFARIYRGDGRVVLAAQLDVTKGNNRLILKMPNWMPSGVYFLTLTDSDAVVYGYARFIWLNTQ